MNTPLSRCIALLFAVLSLTGCDRKERASTRREAPSSDVAPEPDATAPAPSETAPAASPEAPAPAAQPAISAADAAFLAEMKDPAVVEAPPKPADDRAAYEEWFKKYQLDLNDPTMLDGDADNDGFTNRDEFLAGTNPRDAASHPEAKAAHPAIRLKEYNEVRLPLVLESVSGDKAVIRRTDGGEARTETVRAGDMLPGFPLRVARLAERQQIDKDGNPMDRSQVVLEDPMTKETITLVKGLPAKTSASYAVLASDDGKTTLKVRAGEVFAWPGVAGATYRVVDLSRDQIVLQQQETRKMWTISRQ